MIRAGSVCAIPWTTRCPTALTSANSSRASSQSIRRRGAGVSSGTSLCPSKDAPFVVPHESAVPLRPIRSSVPDNDNFGTVPDRYTANLMLYEPPLIARTEADAMNLNVHRNVSPRLRMTVGVFRRG